MADDGQFLDAAGLTVQPAGGLRATGDPWMPFELVDADGGVVAPVAAYLRDVRACGRSRRRCARMGWTCCDGSGSAGLRAWSGIR